MRRFTILLFCLIGCNNSTPEAIKLADKNIEDKLLLSAIAEDIEYVILDNQSDLIYGADKIIFENDRFFVLDNSYTETLAVFSDRGEPLFALEIGLGGPDEFVEITDFDYFPETKELFVFSGSQRKIFVYDDNGKPLREYRIPSLLIVHAIGYLGQDKFAFFRDMVEESKMDLPSQLFTYDFEKEEVIDQAIPLSKNELILGQDYALVRSGTELFASKVYGNSIYSLESDGSIKKELSLSDFTNLNERVDILDDESYRRVMAEERGILYLGAWIGNARSHMFFLKKDQKVAIRWKSNSFDMLVKSIQNDLDLPIFSAYKYLNEEYLIAVLDEEAIALLQGIPNGEEFLRELKPSGEFLSPILAKIKLKDQ